MATLTKNSLFFIVILTSFITCQPKGYYTQQRFKMIEKQIVKLPLKDRVFKWDSLYTSDSLTILQKANILFDKANDLQDLDEEKKAINLYEKALATFEKQNNDEMVAKTLINMGISLAFLNHKNMANQLILKGLKIGDSLHNNYIKSRAYSELAHLFYLKGNKQKSIEYLRKAGELFKKMKDTAALSAMYNNIGILYKEQHKPRKAYQYFLKSFNLKDSLTNPGDLIESYNNLGIMNACYKKQPDSALIYYRKALKLAKKNHLKPINIYENLADLYKKNGQLDSANYYIDKAIATHPENQQVLMHLYNMKLRYLIQQKKDSAALKILKIKDSLVKKNESELVKETEKNLKTKLQLLLKEKKIKQVQLVNKKNRIIFLFIAIIFLLGLLISYQINRLDKLNLKQEQSQLEQKVLRAQMNPHFIFNVLSSIQSSLLENNPILSATYLSKFAQLIRQNFEFIQKKSIPLAAELQMTRNYLDTQKFRFGDKFDYQIKIDPGLDTNHYQVPPMILQPFVENAIEHGFKNIQHKGTLCIKVYKNEENICFDIIDNGHGYQPKHDNKEHALDVFKKRLLMMGKNVLDSFSIESLKKGTKVHFCIPKNYFEQIH